jgi:hypothetical protein
MFNPTEFIELVDGIDRALVRFESTSNHAVMRLYRKSDNPTSPRPQSIASQAPSSRDEMDNSLLVGGDNEHVFLVYL